MLTLRLTIAAAAIAGCAALPSFAQDDATSPTARNIAALADHKQRLIQINAELEPLADFANALRDFARDDPGNALNARAGLSQCFASPLRPFCDLLPAIFDAAAAAEPSTDQTRLEPGAAQNQKSAP